VIGKQGRIVNSIRIILTAFAARTNREVVVEVIEDVAGYRDALESGIWGKNPNTVMPASSESRPAGLRWGANRPALTTPFIRSATNEADSGSLFDSWKARRIDSREEAFQPLTLYHNAPCVARDHALALKRDQLLC